MKPLMLVLALAVGSGCGSNNGATPDGAGGAGGGGGGGGTGVDASLPTTGFPLTGLEQGVTYTANITIGSQSFDVVVDTGSTSLAVAGQGCSNCNATTLYNLGGTDQQTTSTSTYGDGTGWTAENYSDQVAITGDTTQTTMRFGAITDDSQFLRGGYDGILGFLGQDVAVSGTDAFSAKRPLQQVAFELCPNDGRLWLGSPDTAGEASAPEWAGMTNASGLGAYYAVNIQGTTLGSAAVSITGGAVVDSGTSVMVLSSSAATSLTSAITASSGYTSIFGSQTISAENDVQCLDPNGHTRAEIDAALPKLQLTLQAASGGNVTINATASMTYLMPYQQGNETAYCYGVIDGGSGLPTILGDAFMRAFTTTFDIQDHRIGFAPEVGCSLPPVEPPVHEHLTQSIHHPPWRVRGRIVR